MKRVRKKVVVVRPEVVADGVEVAAEAEAVVEAVEAVAMVVGEDVSQTRIIAKRRGNRANHAGRSSNRL
jgi:hypothetical protein